MVWTANDFPKGLKVLLLDGDINSVAETKAKLEAMDYNVSSFSNESAALSAFLSRPEDFHVAVVEVSTSSSQGGFKFLENAKDLPTIMTSNNQCLSTMMKCIALGAVEFLNKPLSEDKLKNIWQHVVHKAFNAGESVLPGSLKPVKESLESMLQLQKKIEQHENKMSIELDNVSRLSDNDHNHYSGSDKYPAPSTPQLKQGERLLNDGDCQEQTNVSTEKESGEHDGDSMSVDTSCENLNNENITQLRKPEKTLIKREDDSADGCKGESAVSLNPHNRKFLSKTGGNTTSPSKAIVPRDSCEIKANRKKMKVDWTPQLHTKFVQAVEQLGVDQAIPSRILELMKVDGLTRHNVASHLQKYRMQKRQIVPRGEWANHRDPIQRSYGAQRPIMAYPPYHSNQTHTPAPVYPIWRQPVIQTAGVQVWGHSSYPLWQPFPGVHMDAWGCPVLPPPQASCFPYTQDMVGLQNAKTVDYRFAMPQNSFEHHPAEEVVDKIVKEAMSKPWLPLPLGLKPPSADSVLAELSKQGISSIPLGSKFSKPH
ncbi:PREDICTED: two-component response regulator-like APRR2 isoform X1 [Lupinus angustifolius]|uniref:two-component response regulator-like APRR2 isoform X1 n=1 Tax=Lupinus angustifolius TaxID=3871 RepID=UPI00092F715D|nr:PREDICTED: two-component response regulator-like APRR2 isoform X1 [Lupinus angustifolius]XP_019444993.1 PREDICTED: two-component response regulator-like APRR2 isoform X1 [Lupinus angustifolius]